MKKTILILILLFSIGSYACDCDGVLTVEKAYKQSEKVFTGKIISVKPYNSKIYENGDETVEEYSTVSVKIEITSLFKGQSKNTIEIITGIGGGDCGYEFAIGEEYLIFAYDNGFHTKKDDGILETTICDGNGKVSDRNKWLKYLNELK
ncbi:MAG: hypothetical protein P8J16_08705 [Polaribacter sp.]|nr:hypothetical protein [Polaribacter sp.]